MGDNGRIDKESACRGYANFLTDAALFTWELSFISMTYFVLPALLLLIPENNILSQFSQWCVVLMLFACAIFISEMNVLNEEFCNK